MVLSVILLFCAVMAILLSLPEKSQDERVDLADFNAEDIASITFKNSAEEWTAVNDDGWRVDDSEKTADYAVASIMDTLLNFSGKLIGRL